MRSFTLLSNSASQPVSLLDSILSKVTRRESNDDVGSLMMQVFNREMLESQRRRTAESLLEVHELKHLDQRSDGSSSSTSTSTVCSECGNQDSALFAPSEDKHYIICQKCGVAASTTAPKSFTFESATRSTVSNERTSTNDGAFMLVQTSSVVANIMRVDSTTQLDHAKRRKARDTGGEHTSVPRGLKNEQAQMNKEAVREAILTDTSLSPVDLRRHDATIIAIHKTFSAAGVQCDGNHLFNRACKIFVNVFTRGCAHSQLCSSDNCRHTFTRRSVKVMAFEATRQLCETMSSDMESDGHAFGLSAPLAKKTVNTLLSQIQKYTLHNSSSTVRASFDELRNTPSEELKQPCKIARPQVTTSPNQHVDLLSLSMAAVEKLAVVNVSLMGKLKQHIRTPEFFSFLQNETAWDTDILALVVAIDAIKKMREPVGVCGVLGDALNRLSKKQRVSGGALKNLAKSIPVFHIDAADHDDSEMWQ